MAKVVDWRDHPPLVEAGARMAALDADINLLEAQIAEAAADKVSEDAAIQELETAVLIGRAPEADLSALRDRHSSIERIVKELTASLEGLQQKRMRLVPGIRQLEAEAQDAAREEFHKQYRPMVKAFHAALTAAIAAHGELEQVFREAEAEALAQGLNDGGGKCFLPNFVWTILTATKTDDENTYARSVRSMEAYLKGDPGPAGTIWDA